MLTASTVLSTMGKEVLLKSMTTVTSKLYALIKFIVSTKHPTLHDIRTAIETTDLRYTISVMDKLVPELSHIYDKDSVKVALHGVTEILNKIHKELDSIKLAYDTHQQKYFNRWRAFECEYDVDTIKKHKIILDNRYGMLVKLLMIYRR